MHLLVGGRCSFCHSACASCRGFRHLCQGVCFLRSANMQGAIQKHSMEIREYRNTLQKTKTSPDQTWNSIQYNFKYRRRTTWHRIL
jgi:predicted nucleic acid-binding Zn finger protein